jgi:hypothetical protein
MNGGLQRPPEIRSREDRSLQATRFIHWLLWEVIAALGGMSIPLATALWLIAALGMLHAAGRTARLDRIKPAARLLSRYAAPPGQAARFWAIKELEAAEKEEARRRQEEEERAARERAERAARETREQAEKARQQREEEAAKEKARRQEEEERAAREKVRAERAAREERERETRQREEQRSWSRARGMSRAQALEILELSEGATREQIQAAYRRLMKQVHPDSGGSSYFAKQLTAAGEVLLKGG